MTKRFAIWGSTGEYSDHVLWVYSVYGDFEKAAEVCNQLNNIWKAAYTDLDDDYLGPTYAARKEVWRKRLNDPCIDTFSSYGVNTEEGPYKVEAVDFNKKLPGGK